MTEKTLLLEEIPAGGGKRLARVTLNAPKALNSLSLDMIRRLIPQLEAWDADPEVVCIWLEGAGDKAFCAGGDIVRIYHGMRAMDGEGDGDPDYPDAFFENEYRLDYGIHCLSTPTVAWGDGIAMGGGLGILQGASHRVVTERARLAMPEIGIGLFPDVGATWFLNRMPGRTGLFCGLTGAQLNAGDALFCGLADRFVPALARDGVLDTLAGTDDWTEPHRVVDRVLRRFERNTETHCPSSHVRRYLDLINHLTDGETLTEIVSALRGLAEHEDGWLARASETLDKGCPTTAALLYEQIRRGARLSLRECFLRELKMARQCIRHPDFREGIRALLIDKDGQPRWCYASVAEVPHDYVEAHFAASWEGEHPLADLPEERP
jgi:enoyl-CoA hydratase/carnithine racemase